MSFPPDKTQKTWFPFTQGILSALVPLPLPWNQPCFTHTPTTAAAGSPELLGSLKSVSMPLSEVVKAAFLLLNICDSPGSLRLREGAGVSVRGKLILCCSSAISLLGLGWKKINSFFLLPFLFTVTQGLFT